MTNPDYAPLVTVYITSHNYGRFIAQAVDSVLAQTLEDFELIIIDDGSTDDSRDIIETYDDPRIITIYQENKGLNVTNNVALRAARGEYVIRLDADDYFDENALAVMSRVLDRQPTVGMVFPDYYHVDIDGHIIEMVRRHDFDDVTLHDQPAHGACTMVRRSCLLDLDGYDESFRCQDGYDLWIRFIERFEVRNVNLPLFFYRQHGSSLTKDEGRLLSTRGDILKRVASGDAMPRSVVAVIPVRGESADPSSPVLRDLGGRALIDWTIEAALTSDETEAVVVTTPDAAVQDHVSSTFADRVMIHDRDPDMARPNTFIEDTLCAAMQWLETQRPLPDAIAYLTVEAPFRGGAAIDTAVNVMRVFQTDVVTGARPENATFFTHNGGGLIPLHQTVGLRLERQELFREVGGLRIIRTAYLMEGGSTSSGQIGHVVLDRRSALTIASRYDWWLAETHAREDTCDATETAREQARV